MSVVVGCWCGRKRRQQCQVEKGIPDHDNSGKQQLGFRVSLMDERKVGTDVYNMLTTYLCMYII